VIEKYPKGNKVPAAYLKQGLSFFKLGENANAKLVLNELIKRFPESSEADAARQHVKQIP
jgi:TolA-binding protein